MTLPEFLKEERAKRGLTQEQMANKIGCSLSHYKNVECGTYKAGVELRAKIAKFVRKSPTFIYKLSQNEKGE